MTDVEAALTSIDLFRVAQDLRGPKPRPFNWATVLATGGPSNVAAATGYVWVRPSNAVLADGTQDIQCRYLSPFPPGPGARVKVDIANGDLWVTGAAGVDDFPSAPFAMSAGSGSLTVTAGTDSGAFGVTFPAGRFTTTPFVFVTAYTSTGAWATAAGGTTSGCNLYLHLRSAGTATILVGWTAIQMTSTTASG